LDDLAIDSGGMDTKRKLKSSRIPNRKMGRTAKAVLSSLAMILAVVAFSHSAAPAPVMIDLGSFEGADTYPLKMNNKGQIAGEACPIDSQLTGLFWEAGSTTPIDIGTLPGCNYTDVSDMNSHGQIVGESGKKEGAAILESYGFIWDPTTMVMTDLPIPSGVTMCDVSSVNDLGVVAGSYHVSPGVSSAVLWDTASGTFIDIGALISGSSSSSANDVNTMGHATGTFYDSSGCRHAFFWDGTTGLSLGGGSGLNMNGWFINDNDMVCGIGPVSMHAFFWDGMSSAVTDIPQMHTSYAITPYDMNEGGVIVGYSNFGYNIRHAFCWSNGVTVDLDPFAGGAERTWACAINEFGEILGGNWTAPGHAPAQACIWEPLSVGYSFSMIGVLPGFTSSDPVAINDNGQVVGYSYGGSMPAHAFMWKPDAEPIASFTHSIGFGPGSIMVVSVDASASLDPDGSIVSYAWDFGDGGTGSGVRTVHEYSSAGVYTITLTVTDEYGQVGMTSATIDGSTTPETEIANLEGMIVACDFSQKVEDDLMSKVVVAAKMLEARKTGGTQAGGARKTGGEAPVNVLLAFDNMVRAYTVIGEINAGDGWNLTSQANLIIALLSYQTLIAGVPCYEWHSGCGPTAAGMVLGYWDGNGFPSLVPGSAVDQTSEVDAMIASPEHDQDYAIYLEIKDTSDDIVTDLSQLGGAHDDNCLADFMHSSFSSENLAYGQSKLDMIDDALVEYTNWISMGLYAGECSILHQSALTWQDIQNEVNAGRPMLCMVDSNADGSTDHLVTLIGYCELGSARLYACFSTWDQTIWWANFDNMHKGNYFGVYAGMTFQIAWT